jgi:uncharacterized protein YraI
MKTFKKLFITCATVIVAVIALSGTAMAATGEATVTASALNMRNGAGTEYEVINTAPRGSSVTVNSDSGNGWYQVTYAGQNGYMFSQYLTFSQNNQQYVSAPSASNGSTGTVQGTYVRFRSGPSLGSSVYDYLHTGTTVAVNGQCGDWYEVEYNGTVGYISSSYLTMGGVYVPTTPSEDTTLAPAPSAPETDNTVTAPPVVDTPVEETPVKGEPMEYESLMVDGLVEDAIGYGFEIPVFADLEGAEKINEFYEALVDQLTEYTKQTVYEAVQEQGTMANVFGEVTFAERQGDLLAVGYAFHVQLAGEEELKTSDRTDYFNMQTGELVEK